MKLVLDASVALKWVLPEPDTPEAVRLRTEFRRGVHELLAPDTFPAEIAHALTKVGRRGVIPPGVASRRIHQLLNTPPRLYPYLPLMTRAVAISTAARIGFYDCLYVALAEREGCDLVTADDRLRRNLPGYPITLLADLP